MQHPSVLVSRAEEGQSDSNPRDREPTCSAVSASVRLRLEALEVAADVDDSDTSG